MYYNPEKNITISRKQLMKELDLFIPLGFEEIEGYYLIYVDEKPIITSYHVLTQNPIKLIDGKYRITYTVSYKPLETLKEMRCNDVTKLFNTISEYAWINSSCGFKIDANEIANRNIEGLIKILKAENKESEILKDYNNNFQTVTLKDLEVIQLEIIKNGQHLYNQMWKFINDINSLSTQEDVMAYNTTFTNMDFSNDNK